MVQNKVLYAFRGWIAFVAFMDLGTAGRSFIENRSFLSKNGLNGDVVLTRMVGMYALLKSLALIHCTLYIHYKPVVSMGYWSLVLTIILYILEAFYYKTAEINFYVIFPCLLNTLTLLGLIYLPSKLKIWCSIPGHAHDNDMDDENSQILRQMNTFRRRKNKNV